MVSRRVFVIWTHPLFIDSIHRLLVHPDINLVGDTSNFGIAEASIMELRPDLVLIEEVENRNSLDVLQLFKRASPSLHIILLSLSDNQMNMVYRKQKFMASQEDLIRFCLAEREDSGE